MHHNYYEKDAEPWDYPDRSLTALCEFCHKDEKATKHEVENDFISFLRHKGYTNMDIVLLQSELDEKT